MLQCRPAHFVRGCKIIVLTIILALPVTAAGTSNSLASEEDTACHSSNGHSTECPLLVPGSPPILTIRSYRNDRVSPDGVIEPPSHTLQLTQFAAARKLSTLQELINHLGPMPRGKSLANSRIQLRRVDILQFRYSNGDRWTVTVSWLPSPHAWSNSGAGIPKGSPYDSRHNIFTYLRTRFP